MPSPRLLIVLLLALAMTTATVLLAIPNLLDDSPTGKALTYFVTTVVGLAAAGMWKGFFDHFQAYRRG